MGNDDRSSVNLIHGIDQKYLLYSCNPQQPYLCIHLGVVILSGRMHGSRTSEVGWRADFESVLIL